MFKIKKGKRSGFTLIELLVVIAIIGLLATIVLVSLNTARVKARDTKRVADLKQIQLAFEMYYDANKNYGPSKNGCVDFNDTEASAGYLKSVMPTLPVDPINDNTYKYQFAVANNTNEINYLVKATIENSSNNPIQSGSSPSVNGCTATAPGEYWVTSKTQ